MRGMIPQLEELSHNLESSTELDTGQKQHFNNLCNSCHPVEAQLRYVRQTGGKTFAEHLAAAMMSCFAK